MPPTSKNQSAIIRTERGLTIAGTRLALYDVMDFLKAGWTPTASATINNRLITES